MDVGKRISEYGRKMWDFNQKPAHTHTYTCKQISDDVSHLPTSNGTHFCHSVLIDFNHTDGDILRPTMNADWQQNTNI